MFESELLSDKGESIQAEEKWQSIFNTLDTEHSDYLFACSELGRNKNANSIDGDGELILTQCLEVAQNSSDPKVFWGESEIKRQLAGLYYQRGNLEVAYEEYKEIIAMKKQVFGENHIYVLQAYRDLYKIDNDLKRYDEALKYQQLALAGLIEYYGQNHLGTVREVFNLGVLYQNMGELEMAEKQMIQAIQIVNENDSDIGFNKYFNFLLGKLYLEMERWDDAESHFLLSIDLYSKQIEGSEKWLAGVKSYLAEVYVGRGEVSYAKELINEVFPTVIKEFRQGNYIYTHAQELKHRCESDCSSEQ